MKSRGLGDTIAKLAKYTGVKAVVKKVAKNCGCEKRQNVLNKKFPYKK